jgi:hypothetical protein
MEDPADTKNTISQNNFRVKENSKIPKFSIYALIVEGGGGSSVKICQ